MKRSIALIIVLLLTFSVSVFGAEFTIEDNPDYVSPLVSKAPYNTGQVIDFNTKSTAIFHGYSNAWFVNTKFSWAEGASGEDGDFAPYVEMTTDDAVVSTLSTVDYLYMLYGGSANYFLNDGGTVYTEFDVKLNTNTDALYLADFPMWVNTGTMEDWKLFDSNGKIVGTDFEYPANEWMHISMQFNTVAKIWNVWVDDEQIVTNAPKRATYHANSTRYNFLLRQKTAKEPGQTRAGYSIDNFRCYAIGGNIENEVSIDFEDSQGMGGYSAAPCVGSSIILSFSKAIDEALLNEENIAIEDAYGNALPYEAEIAGGEYRISPEKALISSAQYKIRISDEIRKEINAKRPPVGALTFAAADERPVTVSTMLIAGKASKKDIKGGDKLSITANFSNKSGAQEALAAVCIYDSGNGLAAFDNTVANLSAGNSASLELTAPEGFSENHQIVLFVFEGADNLIVSDTYTFE